VYTWSINRVTNPNPVYSHSRHLTGILLQNWRPPRHQRWIYRAPVRWDRNLWCPFCQHAVSSPYKLIFISCSLAICTFIITLFQQSTSLCCTRLPVFTKFCTL
jgi:hypothetical protein